MCHNRAVTDAQPDSDPRLRQIPPVHALLETAEARRLLANHARPVVLQAVRARLAVVRQALRDGGDAFSSETFWSEVRRSLKEGELTCRQRVINATGIVIHTNLGRAPLADAAVEAVRRVASGYSNLELDLASGKRGGRGGQTEALLCRLTGAEAAAVVNNNAAAVLLALSALAAGGEVVISRGELVEIGGAFRVPDVIRQSGARLVEVGTTNKTRLSDYADVITPDTKVLLKVHASNYKIIGFTAEAALSDLARLGRERGLAVMQDLGSGALIDLTRYGLPHEPTAAEAIGSGADVVAFSGDKLLGGPQCGILAGRSDLIRRLAVHPLFRALRADKMTLAALEATLRLYEDPERLRDTLPVLHMLAQSPEELGRRARRLRGALAR
ncbi:MAG: L-seryl-tRNA(Sec) selenium transferase, partial [Armatimonadetes bacterium]|nr:L-seryl-tRNA(Sec) selenium transferase [Armatimonadota bacterium]